MLRQESGAVASGAIVLAGVFGLLPAVRLGSGGRRTALAAAAFAAWMAVSILWARDLENSVSELARVAGYFASLALVLMFVGRDNWRHAAGGLGLALVTIVAFAVTSRTAPDLFPEDSFARLSDEVRLSYPLGYWNAVACVCAMAIGGALGLAVRPRAALRHWAAAAVPLASAGIYLTDSRGAVVAGLVAAAVVVVLAADRAVATTQAAVATIGSAGAVALLASLEIGKDASAGEQATATLALAGLLAATWALSVGMSRLTGSSRFSPAGKQRGVAFALVVVAIGCAVAVATSAQTVTAGSADRGAAFADERVESAQGPLASVDESRQAIFGSALRAVSEAPVVGIGAGGFEFWWLADRGAAAPIKDAHSWYLETLAELGLVGALLLAVALASLLAFALHGRRELKRSRDLGGWAAMMGVGVAFLVQAGVDWMWEVPAVSVTGLAALLIAGAAASKPRNRRTRGLTPFVVAIVALLAVALQVPGVVKNERLRAGKEILALGFTERSEELANEAEAAEPWAASPHALLAQVHLAREEFGDAEREIREAIDVRPRDWSYRFTLVRIAVARDETERALDALAEAERLNPDLSADAGAIRLQLQSGQATTVEPLE